MTRIRPVTSGESASFHFLFPVRSRSVGRRLHPVLRRPLSASLPACLPVRQPAGLPPLSISHDYYVCVCVCVCVFGLSSSPVPLVELLDYFYHHRHDRNHHN